MKLSPGKQRGLEAISDDNNIIFATAMDQRGSLGTMIKSLNDAITYEDGLKRFKEGVSEVLGNQSSSLLLDPEYGWDAAEKLNKDVGLIMAYEKTGYDANESGRLPNLVDDYAVQDIVERGASALKLLIYYNQHEEGKYNKMKNAFIKRVGDECKQNDILFILEPVSYSPQGLSGKDAEFVKEKPEVIEFFMEEFSKESYGVDLLKVEVPVTIFHIEGYSQFKDYQPVFTKEEASRHYLNCSEKSRVPFIYLSGGVTNEEFVDTLHFAKESKSKFSGVLCGRATWKSGVEIFATQEKDVYYEWLQTQGMANLNTIKTAVGETAMPWDKF